VRRRISLKKWLKIALAAVLVVVVAFVATSAYLGYSMTRVKRVPLTRDPGVIGLAYENVAFPSRDKSITLKGWFLPSEDSQQVVVMVHGNWQNRDDPSIGTMEIAAGLVKGGFNVLMFDLRGYGDSGGSRVGGGYLEKRDLEGAVDYLKSRGFGRIGVLGFSLGAVTSLLAAAEDADIKAVVSDSSFADLNDIMGPEFARRTHAPRVFLKPILFMIKLMYGVDFAAIRPIDGLPMIAPRPVLFIHGGADATIPVAHAYRLFEAADNPADELWVVTQAGHTQSYKSEPQEYLKRVIEFFDKGL